MSNNINKPGGHQDAMSYQHNAAAMMEPGHGISKNTSFNPNKTL
jgi:hypothetical protein